MDSSFSEHLARSGFAHRASDAADGAVVYRLADKSGSVRIPGHAWRRLGDEFSAALAPTRRRTRILSIALFPAILIFAMTLGQHLPFAGILILMGVVGGPIVIYLMHARDVQTIRRSIEARLRSYPRCAAMPPDASRLPRALEIAIMLMVGPYLLLAIIGEIGGPDTYRGTPLSGLNIGPFQLLALGLMGLRLLWPRLALRFTIDR